MTEPKRYTELEIVNSFENSSAETEYFLADDPAIAQWKRSHEAMGKLIGIVNKVEWVKLSIESTGVEIDAVGGGSAAAYIRRFKVAAPNLIEAIEKVEG